MKTHFSLAFLFVASALAAAEPPAMSPLPDAATPPATDTPPAVAPPTGGTKSHASVLSRLRLPPAVQKATAAIKPPPVSPRFAQIRGRISDLYLFHHGPPREFDPATNPFRNAGISLDPVAVVPATARTDAELLKQAAALVKVSGWTEYDGQTLLTINQTLCRDSDKIKVTVNGQTLSLRVSKFTRTNLTLTLNEAEITKRY